jgi:hypothetical protein
MTPTVDATHYAALERLSEANAEARALAEVLCYIAAVLRGARPDPDGPLLGRAVAAADRLLRKRRGQVPGHGGEASGGPAFFLTVGRVGA